MQTYNSINPYTLTEQAQFPSISNQELEQVLNLAQQGYKVNQQVDIGIRLKQVRQVRELLAARKMEIAACITLEMGKPIQEAIAEVEKSMSLGLYYEQHSEQVLQEVREVGQAKVMIRPLGVILGIMPWNFPVWQVFRFAIPTLIAGNAVVLKHAPQVPLCALAIHNLFHEAGFDHGEYHNVFISHEQVAQVLSSKNIAGVSLTGSEKAGRAVGQLAGLNLKPQLLELGGSDPFMVMPSANIELAVQNALASRLVNGGQSCVAAKRFIVHEQVYDAFTKGLLQALSEVKMGDPTLSSTQIGPMARKELVDALEQQVLSSIALGARLLFEKKYEGEGHGFAPIRVLTDLQKGMPAYEQELFGPVFSLFKVSSMEQALQIANDSDYGLAASVWTNNEQEKNMALTHIEAGAIFLNSMVKSDPSLPFGGVKNSGFGREMAKEGLLSFCNITTVVEG